MRALATCAVAVFLAACNPHGDGARSDSACVRVATRSTNWSSEQSVDTISARAEGPTCAQSVVTFTIRNADGDPLWTFASTFYEMTVGGRTDEPAAVSAEEVDSFLASWVDVTVNRSSDLPAWTEGADALSAAADGMSYYTDLNRETYEDLRGRNLPQLCFAAGVDSSRCLVVDPHTHAPLAIVAFGA